ncbi:helix-turn-helix domain-containing protein [Streptococcus suis]|uniref:helix-turn-helix domain-containing protein n=1 Tax=Streptococcus suis TaxID=1307 RepID=UPI000CF50663|nr:XRE family transcriptional regulator [Streptococcus suis]
MILGDILKEFRSQNKLSMDRFAELSGLTKGYISMLEKNQHPKTKKALLPTMETLEKVAKGMNIAVTDLIQKLDDNQAIALTLTPAQFGQFNQAISEQAQFLDQTLEGEFHDRWIAFGQEQMTIMQTVSTPQSASILRLDDYREQIDLAVPGKVSAGTGYWQDSDFDNLVSFYSEDIPDSQQYDTIAQVVGDSMAPSIQDGDYLFIRLTPDIPLNSIGIFSVNGENFVKKYKGTYLQSLNPDYEDIYLSEEDHIRPIGRVVDVYSPS